MINGFSEKNYGLKTVFIMTVEPHMHITIRHTWNNIGHTTFTTSDLQIEETSFNYIAGSSEKVNTANWPTGEWQNIFVVYLEGYFDMICFLYKCRYKRY